VAVITEFWRREREKIHQQLFRVTVSGNQLEDVAWRIDVPTDRKGGGGVGQPTAVVRLDVTTNTKDAKAIVFTANSEAMQQAVATLATIDKRVAKWI